MTVHPQTGKRERIYVNLAAVYPTPEEAGTELSFEEIIAANRGWLDYTWEEEDEVDVSFVPDPVEEIREEVGEKLVIHQDRPDAGEKLVIHQDRQNQGEKLVIHQDRHDVGEKLVIHQDQVLYDENGVVQEPPRQPRGGKKKKVMEVNETQISKSLEQSF